MEELPKLSLFGKKKPLSIFRLLHPYPKGCIKYDYTSHTKSDSTPHEMPKFINHETDDSTGIFSSNSSIFELHSISWFFENSGPSYSPVYPQKKQHTPTESTSSESKPASWEAELRRTERRAFTALVMELRKDENSAKATSTTAMANL